MTDTPLPRGNAHFHSASDQLRDQVDHFAGAELPAMMHCVMAEQIATHVDPEHGRDDVRRIMRLVAALLAEGGMPAAGVLHILGMVHTVNTAAKAEAVAKGVAETAGWGTPVMLLGMPTEITADTPHEQVAAAYGASTMIMLMSNRKLSFEQLIEVMRRRETEVNAALDPRGS